MINGTNEPVYNEKFSLKEFYNVLSSVKETSAGPDTITYSMIKNAHDSLHIHILTLFNDIFISNKFPSSWRIATIIPKPNKDRTTPLNFRPISLTNCLCKILEKMVNLRLVWFLEKEQCLSNAQSGFRRNRSTTDCLVQITSDIQQAIIRKQHCIAVFFDLLKAYDKTWKHGILKQLQKFGLSGNLPNFIKNFLSGRKINVRIGSILSNATGVDEGVPQGSVLSCTLFGIAIDGVIETLRHSQVQVALYVDDLTIYAVGSTESAERRIQNAIKCLQDWSNKTGFQFSPAKTVGMHICRARVRGGTTWCPKNASQLQLNGCPISFSETHMYLGVLMDNSLRFHKHVAYVRSECQKRLSFLRHLSHTHLGADNKTLLQLYHALIKYKIEYGIEAYGSTCKSNLEKLNPIQTQALRIATGTYRTSPVKSLQVLTGVKSLEDSRNEKLANYLVRVLLNPSNPVRQMLIEMEEEEQLEEDPQTIFIKYSIVTPIRCTTSRFDIKAESLWTEKFNEFPPWKLDNISVCDDKLKNAKSSVNDRVLQIIFKNHILTHSRNNFIFYTDGSKTTVAFATIGFQPLHPVAVKSLRLPCTRRNFMLLIMLYRPLVKPIKMKW